jgi:mRNA-degrading endonuclease RelE of RelBE toxin-antitoxin system
MSYGVEWSETAQNQLAAIWLAARDRQWINEVVDELNVPLAEHPNQLGESREEDLPNDVRLRILFEGPLRLIFAVDDTNRQVRVISVARIPRPL